jgi:F-type H+-transporting ATPase subunit b
MHVNGWTFALQVVNFLILVWLLNRFLYQPLTRSIDHRRQQIEDVLESAAGREQDAQQHQRTYEALLAGIDAERQRLLAGAKAEAEEECRRLLALARAQADETKAAMWRKAESERNAMAAAISDWAIETAITLSGRLLSDLSPEAPTDLFLARTLRELHALPAGRRDNLRSGLAAGARLVVATAQPLDDVSMARWQNLLRAEFELGRPVQVGFATDPSLVAGVELRFPDAVVAHSWRDALQSARDRMLSHARSH